MLAGLGLEHSSLHVHCCRCVSAFQPPGCPLSDRLSLTEETVQGPLISEPKVHEGFRVVDKVLNFLWREHPSLLARRWQRPTRCPNKHLGSLDDWLNRGEDLDGRGPRSYQDDVLALQVDGFIPVRAMYLGSLEGIESRGFGPCWLVEVPRGMNQDVTPVAQNGPRLQILGCNIPLSLVIVPRCLYHNVGKADVVAQIIFCRKVVIVLFKLSPAGDGGGEVCLWLEGICVVVCWNVARTTRVSVLKPCPSNLRIFLINLECRVSQIVSKLGC